MHTPSIQDYLKAIYAETEQNEQAMTSSLAARLGVAPASVTGMLQRLANGEPPLVHYRKHQGATLTETGTRLALEVIRHHRLLETYLVRMLGYNWADVHHEACRLEHVISEDFEHRIAQALGHPERDPHGDPIPSPELVMPTDDSQPLYDCRPPANLVVQRVNSDNPDLLRRLQTLGLVPGSAVRLTDFSPLDQLYHLQLGNAPVIVVGANIACQVYVVASEGDPHHG